MLVKRFFTIVALSTLLLTSFAACSKKENNEQETTPTSTAAPTGTVEIPLNELIATATPSPETIILGGYFDRDNINISIYYTDTWYINGIYYGDSLPSSLFLTGSLSHKEGAELLYTDANNELSFVFTNKSMTIKANKGSDYSIFEGYYERKEQAISTEETLTPKKDSALELIGRSALTYYMLKADGLLDCMIEPSETAFDNSFMIDFIRTYSDLFLVSEAVFSEEISDQYLCYAFSEEALNRLLLTASNGKFGISNLDVSGTDVVFKDNTYYVPCYGNFAGGISTRFTSDDPESIPMQLLLDGAVTKKDGTMYDIDMNLTTSTENASEATGVNIQSIRYKVTK